jgi:hypothetical protein
MVDTTTPTIRDTIMTALVTRIAAQTGWTAQLRSGSNEAGDGVTATVFMTGEDKKLANIDQYNCTLLVGVEILAQAEDADATIDAGNPYRYLDRLVSQAEQVIHEPDDWGLDPDYTDVQILGHEVRPPSDDVTLAALLRLQFTYRCSIATPQA